MATFNEEKSKPVVVRVKRKSWQSKLDGFWLEINERPLKQQVLDFDKLAVDDQVGGVKGKKLFVQHVETVGSSEDTVDVVQSLVYDFLDGVDDKREIGAHKRNYKKDTKQEELLLKGKRDQEVLSRHARFEQIWRSRRGSKQTLDNQLHSMCHFYDVVRVPDEEGSSAVQELEATSLEDQKILSSHLPIPREYIPSAVAEIESDIYSYLSEQGYDVVPRSIADIDTDIHAHLYKQDDCVFDYYTVNDDMDISKRHAISLFPVVQVEEGDTDLYDGPDCQSEYDSDNSNAEGHPQNDYPDETSEESTATDEEIKEEDSDGASIRSEDEESDKGSSTSAEFEDVRHQDEVSDDDEILDDDSNDNVVDYKNINEDLRDLDINQVS